MFVCTGNKSRVGVIARTACYLIVIVAIAAPSTVVTAGAAASRRACRGVHIKPGDNIQALIDGSPRQTRFCFARGRYDLSATIWTGNKSPTLDLRAGAIIDGQSGDFTGIGGMGAPRDRPGTIVLGGVFQNFGNENSAPWVAPVILSRKWIVKGSEFRNNFNYGLLILGDDARVTSADIHHNGRYGLVVTKACEECLGPKDVIVEDTEISYNNTRQLDPSYDAGGTKFSAGTDGTVVRGNEIHHNYGSGVWFDGFNQNARIYNNSIHDNYRWGIFWEISYGGVRIHHNHLTGNGEGDGGSNAFNAQVIVADSDGGQRGIEIYDNTIVGSAFPVSLIDDSGRSGATSSVYVHHNVMTLRAESQVGAFGADLFAPEANNRFESNTYRVIDRGGSYWAWNAQTLTWKQWRGIGNDNQGSLRLIE